MKNKVPVLIIILGVLATIFLLYSNNRLKEEITVAEGVKKVSDKQLEIYRDIDNHYGRASDQFYANKPIVVLRGNGATEVIRVYWEMIDKSYITAHANWDDSLKGDWGEIDGKWSPLTITSKIDKGCETIRFTNKENNDAFEILVIVK